MAPGPLEHPAGVWNDLRPGIGRDDREPDRLEARVVVDVVSEIGNYAHAGPGTRCLGADDRQLVLDALDASRSQLLRPAGDDRIRLGRHDHVGDADLVEAAEAEPVAPPACDRLLAGLAHPHAVVGEDAVEVEDDEPQRPDLVVGGRVTGRRQPAADRRARTPRRPGRRPRRSARMVSSSASARVSGRPIRSSSAYGGRPPSAGDFATRSPSASTWPAASARAATSFFPIFCERLLLARKRPLDAVADRDRDAPQVAHELPHALGHQRERVVGALRRVAEREVLLDHARAEHVGDECHRDPVLVVGEARRRGPGTARGTS